jgi:N-acetylglucosamine kinase-like BadF-type ATPase
MSKEKLNLAIDSGATTASWALFEEPGLPLAAGKTGGVNYTGQGRKGLEALFASLAGNMVPRCIIVIGLAMAGAGRENVRVKALDDLTQILPSSFPEASLYLFHDGEAALWRTLGKGVGIVVSAGTGSIAFGIDDEGMRMRCGGWGPIAGDEGSAYWIAVQAVSHILRSFDGRETKTELEALILRKI